MTVAPQAAALTETGARPFLLDNPEIEFAWANLAAPAGVLTDATGSGDGPLLMQFLSLSADDLRTGLAEAGATFDRLGAQDSLAVKIPLLNKSVSELLAGDAEPAVFSAPACSKPTPNPTSAASR